MLTLIGLALILVAWLEQLTRAVIKNKLFISPFFLLLYITGVVFLTLSGVRDSDLTVAVMNGIVLIPSIIIFIMILAKDRKTG